MKNNDEKVEERVPLGYGARSWDHIDRSITGMAPPPGMRKAYGSGGYTTYAPPSSGIGAQFREILNCSVDNSSRTCPGLSCNHAKEETENSNVYGRNIPGKKLDIVLDLRPQGQACRQYKVEPVPEGHDYKVKSKPVSSLTPGMGMYHDRAQNVNLESDLLNITRRVQNYPCHKYTPPCSDCDVPKCAVELPFCARQGHHGFPAAGYNNNSAGFQDDNVGLKYSNNMGDLRACEWECENINERSRYHYGTVKQPYYVKELPKPLEVGPNRRNQLCESLWNNVTRRRIGTSISGLKQY
tara:strand:- start:1277 stop:2167 length:891 start_codon:yes stop_codon:yes gene_type:complete